MSRQITPVFDPFKHASLIAQLIEVATESRWPTIRDDMLDKGYTPEEIMEAVNGLCALAHVSPLISPSDFT